MAPVERQQRGWCRFGVIAVFRDEAVALDEVRVEELL
jgi:hypothetical protein